jgi:DNA-3-methyladenine glycosylase
VARDLLGQVLYMRRGDHVLAAPILETEAYTPEDPASHSYRGLTARTRVMFGPPGFAYVYFIYGMYHCLNAVTESDGVGAAVLIRAVQGIKGPGRLCRQFGIDLQMNGWDLTSSDLSILAAPGVPDERITQGPRVGITRGAALPRRFRI